MKTSKYHKYSPLLFGIEEDVLKTLALRCFWLFDAPSVIEGVRDWYRCCDVTDCGAYTEPGDFQLPPCDTLPLCSEGVVGWTVWVTWPLGSWGFMLPFQDVISSALPVGDRYTPSRPAVVLGLPKQCPMVGVYPVTRAGHRLAP